MDPVKRVSEWQSSDGSRNLLCFTYRVDANAFFVNDLDWCVQESHNGLRKYFEYCTTVTGGYPRHWVNKTHYNDPN